MKKSPLYTRTGDSGTTQLVSGNRLGKDSLRIETYGTVDELNAHIGLLASLQLPDPDLLRPLLLEIQHRLFDLGAYLATDPEALRPGSHTPAPPTCGQIDSLETSIDTIDSTLPPMCQFVLPGGTTAAAQAHVARTVCRQAERHAVGLSRISEVDPKALAYLNRLSDLLFAIARFCNIHTTGREIFWQKSC